MLYFAYGSNLDWEQMRQRCPSARFVCKAELKGYALAFTRKSTTRNCGVADVVPEEGCSVWGVVYQIDETDIGRLDRSEGYAPGRATNAYTRGETRVLADGEEARPLTVWMYVASKQPQPPKPNGEYKRLIVDGAKFWHLPQNYRTKLEEIEVEG